MKHRKSNLHFPAILRIAGKVIHIFKYKHRDSTVTVGQ